MAIYNNLKCVYVHIPKTGGQSIMNMLSQAEANHTIDDKYELDHLTMSQTLERMKPEHYFKFAIVRHPMERLISEYQFSKKYRPYLPDTDHFTFAEYTQAISQLPIDEMPHKMVNHLYTQTKFVYDNDRLLVDYIGRFEALPYAIKCVAQKLEKEFPALPHLNKSTYDEELYAKIACDTQTKLLVRQMYAEDYKRFGYGVMPEPNYQPYKGNDVLPTPVPQKTTQPEELPLPPKKIQPPNPRQEGFPGDAGIQINGESYGRLPNGSYAKISDGTYSRLMGNTAYGSYSR